MANVILDSAEKFGDFLKTVPDRLHNLYKDAYELAKTEGKPLVVKDGKLDLSGLKDKAQKTIHDLKEGGADIIDEVSAPDNLLNKNKWGMGGLAAGAAIGAMLGLGPIGMLMVGLLVAVLGSMFGDKEGGLLGGLLKPHDTPATTTPDKTPAPGQTLEIAEGKDNSVSVAIGTTTVGDKTYNVVVEGTKSADGKTAVFNNVVVINPEDGTTVSTKMDGVPLALDGKKITLTAETIEGLKTFGAAPLVTVGATPPVELASAGVDVLERGKAKLLSGGAQIIGTAADGTLVTGTGLQPTVIREINPETGKISSEITGMISPDQRFFKIVTIAKAGQNGKGEDVMGPAIDARNGAPLLPVDAASGTVDLSNTALTNSRRAAQNALNGELAREGTSLMPLIIDKSQKEEGVAYLNLGDREIGGRTYHVYLTGNGTPAEGTPNTATNPTRYNRNLNVPENQVTFTQMVLVDDQTHNIANYIALKEPMKLAVGKDKNVSASQKELDNLADGMISGKQPEPRPSLNIPKEQLERLLNPNTPVPVIGLDGAAATAPARPAAPEATALATSAPAATTPAPATPDAAPAAPVATDPAAAAPATPVTTAPISQDRAKLAADLLMNGPKVEIVNNKIGMDSLTGAYVDVKYTFLAGDNSIQSAVIRAERPISNDPSGKNHYDLVMNATPDHPHSSYVAPKLLDENGKTIGEFKLTQDIRLPVPDNGIDTNLPDVSRVGRIPQMESDIRQGYALLTGNKPVASLDTGFLTPNLSTALKSNLAEKNNGTQLIA